MTQTFSPKDPSEIIVVSCDFAAVCAAPSNAVVTAQHDDGPADASPQALISGAAQINGTVVLQRLQGGVEGTAYKLRFQVDGADGSRFVEACLIRVMSA
jgi:hypothetical protein